MIAWVRHIREPGLIAIGYWLATLKLLELNVLGGIKAIVLGVQRYLNLQLLVTVLIVGEDAALYVGRLVTQVVYEIHHLALLELTMVQL